jgi:hypothetical protein
VSDSLFSLNIERDARISPCGRYRWSLSRNWDWGRPWLGWIMLNPSTADARTDDPTIKKCMKFARRWGFGGIAVRNLFSFLATDPDDLLPCPDPVGCEGTAAILDLVGVCPRIIVAWGAIHPQHHCRARAVFDELRRQRVIPFCLGKTAGGWPRHPLFVRDDTNPVPYMECPGGNP